MEEVKKRLARWPFDRGAIFIGWSYTLTAG